MSKRATLTKAEEALLESLREALLTRPRAAEIRDDLAAEMSRLIKAMVAAPPTLVELVGPVCATGQAVAWLGVSRQALNKAVGERRVVAVRSSDGKWFYPTWQFSRTGVGSDKIAPVLDRLRSTMDEAAAAAWFIHPNPQLDGQTPVEWMAADGSREALYSAAKAAARRHNPEERTALQHSTAVETTALTEADSAWI